MTYRETLEWLFAQLPMYQTIGAVAYKADLSNTLELAAHLNQPQNHFKTIHIAGTNGKGSTSSMIASVLQEAGYRVGLYTSPHLVDFRERIKINGQEIPEWFVCQFVAQNKAFFEARALSFFEMTVGLAFDYFQKQQVDVAVIEVGMGGRLDSTNIINPLLSVITNIDLDHTAFLGHTLEAIAREKAGIIKAGVPVVVGEYTRETRRVFEQKATEQKAPIYFASDLLRNNTHQTDLLGAYQQHNLRTARQAIALLRDSFDITETHETRGLLKVVENTKLSGRWQILSHAPKVIADTAHNPHGLRPVMQQLKEERCDQLWIVLGVVSDKDLQSILPLFPKEANYLFCKPNLPRGLDAAVLAQQAQLFGLSGTVCDSVAAAYAKALAQAGSNDVIYVGGSTFVVAEIL